MGTLPIIISQKLRVFLLMVKHIFFLRKEYSRGETMTLLRNIELKEIWYVAATFIGTVIGAGFASGQEILKFFSHYGPGGIAGILFSCLLFSISGTMIMYLGSKLEASSFADVIRHVCGKRFGLTMDLLLGVFLFGTLSVMLAGSGAVFSQQWGLPFWFGTGATLIITVLTALFGLKGVIRANTLIVPLMIFFCLLVTLPAISSNRLHYALSDFIPAGDGAAPHWLLSALLYVSYNITLGTSVLAPISREIRSPSSLLWGGIFGGLGLGGLAMLINLAILCNYPAAARFEVPSLFVASHLTPVIQLIFSFVLWAEIFSTIIGTLFGLAVRLAALTRLNYNLIIIALMITALGLSQLGFAGLVGIIYPMFGYISLFFLAALLAYPILRSKQ